jgi:predicted histone-like DNA-binding protein
MLVASFIKCGTFALSQKHCDEITAARSLILNSQLSIINMIRYVLKQNNNEDSRVYGKWFAYPVIEETLNLDGLADHMSNHNSPFSKGTIKGLLTDMVNCIKEELLDGKNVKIDGLAIFSIGIKNKKGGAASEEDFNVSKNISNVKLRARATGDLSVKALNLEATLKKATALTGKETTGAGGESGNEGGNETPSTGD